MENSRYHLRTIGLSARRPSRICGRRVTLPIGGLYYGKILFYYPHGHVISPIPFPKGIFVSNDGLHGRNRISEIHPVTRLKTKNNGKRFDRNRLPCFYFQPWNTSSNAFFRAAFMLFSNSRRISNSKVDFFFFFFRSCWLLISRVPH